MTPTPATMDRSPDFYVRPKCMLFSSATQISPCGRTAGFALHLSANQVYACGVLRQTSCLLGRLKPVLAAFNAITHLTTVNANGNRLLSEIQHHLPYLSTSHPCGPWHTKFSFDSLPASPCCIQYLPLLFTGCMAPNLFLDIGILLHCRVPALW